VTAARADTDRLEDMLRAVVFIRSRMSDAGRAFQSDEMTQVAVLHSFQVVGEAAAGVSDELRAQHPEVPWALLVGMRNQIVHKYFDVDLPVVLETARTDLPVLEAQISAMLADVAMG
jgi:uncharacterized protein with HEPN domain